MCPRAAQVPAETEDCIREFDELARPQRSPVLPHDASHVGDGPRGLRVQPLGLVARRRVVVECVSDHGHAPSEAMLAKPGRIVQETSILEVGGQHLPHAEVVVIAVVPDEFDLLDLNAPLFPGACRSDCREDVIAFGASDAGIFDSGPLVLR